MRTDRINFLDLFFDPLSFREVEDRLRAATDASPYGYVVTPNVDHIVRLHREPALREVYEAADLCVCDSRVLKLLARLRGIKLPLVPGSDLSAALFSHIINPGDRIAVVGADSSCLEQLKAKFHAAEFLHFEPPMDLRQNADGRREAAEFISNSHARFALIAVGSPQQEMIASEVRRHDSPTGLALCIGAGLDFITGKQKRAPKLFQSLGLEWAHRLLSNPRRLWHRYMVEGLRIFPIWIRWRAPRRALLVAAFSLLGLLLGTAFYFVLTFSRGYATGSSIRLWLPPPSSQSAAAVKSLPAPNLLKPVSPQEATKVNAERPFVPRPDSPAKRFILRTDADDRARALTCLAQAVYYEAAGEGGDGGRAVAQVVLNRVRHPGFPSTICGVVYEGADRATGCQFSFTCDGSMQRVPVPWLWTRSKQIAEEALSGQVFAPVGHATHYHADYVVPYWSDSLDKSVQIGRHIFYRLRSVFGEPRAFSQHYGGTEPPFREPGTTIVIPQSPEGQQLATALISDGAQVQKTKDPQPAKPDTPLLIDSLSSTLLVDGQVGSPQLRRKKKASDCSAAGDGKQLAPLGATDMRAGDVSLTC
jgi:exopolysaccharide biosynthesis WecB/TagA/CpsF family protein